MYSTGMWPLSPNAFKTTLPDGDMLNQVMLAWFSDILSQASGGNWRALFWENTNNMRTK